MLWMGSLFLETLPSNSNSKQKQKQTYLNTS